MPLNFEFLISQSLLRSEVTTFSGLSQNLDFGGNIGPLSDARQEFLSACVMQGLVAEEGVARLPGESSLSTVPARQSKEDVIRAYGKDVHKFHTLLSGIERTDGNAGAFAQAISEVSLCATRDVRKLTAQIFTNYCLTKDTMSLKTICNLMAARPLALDIVFMFVAPTSLLSPLCHLLDDWKYDDDQGILRDGHWTTQF